MATSTNGYSALYRGWVPTLLRDIPFSAIYWSCYELLKPAIMSFFDLKRQNWLVWCSAGTVAGSIAAVVTLPFDVVKTHRQVEIGDIEALHASKRPSSTFDVMRSLYRQNGGVSALFRGLTPRLIKVAPSCAIMIGSYEYGKAYFRRKNHEQRSS